MKIMVDIEHSISYDDLDKFKELADVWNKPVQETIEICMFEKRDEYLDNFKNNVPDTTQQEE